eukprot:9491138-Pyramimonas_sp.AAC.1
MYSGDVLRTEAVYISIVAHDGDVLHAAATVYIGAVVYTRDVVNAGTVVHTGAVVQIATYMVFLPVR